MMVPASIFYLNVRTGALCSMAMIRNYGKEHLSRDLAFSRHSPHKIVVHAQHKRLETSASMILAYLLTPFFLEFGAHLTLWGLQARTHLLSAEKTKDR